MERSFATAIPLGDPETMFPGVIVVAVPHMDDEALACSGTLAQLRDKTRVHLVYATDGMKSPEPVLPWRDSISQDLGAVRRRESQEAMTSLGIPAANLCFLDLPESRLEHHRNRLETGLWGAMERIRPDHVLVPFRYDRHRDHIAVHAASMAVARRLESSPRIWEYFVYHRWRILPRRDVRAYIAPGHLFQVDISTVSTRKRAALACFTSQTTRFYRWQSRPNLTPALLDAVSREPEMFLQCRPDAPDTSIFDGWVPWIRIAHRLESPLKRTKDRAVAVWRRTIKQTV